MSIQFQHDTCHPLSFAQNDGAKRRPAASVRRGGESGMLRGKMIEAWFEVVKFKEAMREDRISNQDDSRDQKISSSGQSTHGIHLRWGGGNRGSLFDNSFRDVAASIVQVVL